MKHTISKENFELLSKMIQLAKQREPIQGKFAYTTFNYIEDENDKLQDKEGIANCGTVGCLAGGYLPLINSRFHFNRSGLLLDMGNGFNSGRLSKELKGTTFSALFYPNHQYMFGLPNLDNDATKQQVIESMEKILSMLIIE